MLHKTAPLLAFILKNLVSFGVTLVIFQGKETDHSWSPMLGTKPSERRWRDFLRLKQGVWGCGLLRCSLPWGKVPFSSASHQPMTHPPLEPLLYCLSYLAHHLDLSI